MTLALAEVEKNSKNAAWTRIWLMMKVSEISETLAVRIHYGIKEELFDLVLRLENVARVRARVLYDTGYHTASQVKNENPYLLHKKTGLGINLCRNIVK